MNDNIKSPLDLHAETADNLIREIESNGISAISDELYEALAALKSASDSRWIVCRARLKAIREISIGDIENMQLSNHLSKIHHLEKRKTRIQLAVSSMN